MRHQRTPAAEKAEILELVRKSPLGIKETLDQLGLPPSTYYTWRKREATGRLEDGGRIVECGFQTIGCAAAIAAGSAITEMVKGKSAGEVRAVSAEDVEEALGGLPLGKQHCAALAVQAHHAALEALTARSAPGRRSSQPGREARRLPVPLAGLMQLRPGLPSFGANGRTTRECHDGGPGGGCRIGRHCLREPRHQCGARSGRRDAPVPRGGVQGCVPCRSRRASSPDSLIRVEAKAETTVLLEHYQDEVFLGLDALPTNPDQPEGVGARDAEEPCQLRARSRQSLRGLCPVCSCYHPLAWVVVRLQPRPPCVTGAKLFYVFWMVYPPCRRGGDGGGWFSPLL